MKISLNWINDQFIDTTLSPNELESKLTSLGLECSFKIYKIDFKDVVLGKVIECKKHPDADRLFLCKVDLGDNGILQVVCGAPNVKKNIHIAFAKIGASLKNGNFIIKKTKIRGQESYGMICSGEELSYNDDTSGILIVKSNAPLGLPIEKILEFKSDTIFDIDLTPNRGDCFSHLGVAREIGIAEGKKVIFDLANGGLNKVERLDNFSINVSDPKACKRYTALIVKNLEVKDSPKWLKIYLNSIGLRSKNNVVDVTNFIMMNYGIPIHAFDADKIKGAEIHIRFAKDDETITTIDGKEIHLKSDNLIIADKEEPIAIAGVMGGLNSSVTDKTKNVLIECAYFDPICIRRSSKSCNISSDSSRRYERGVDFKILPKVLYETFQLLLNFSKNDQKNDFIDLIESKFLNKKIVFNYDECNNFIGVKIDINEYTKIFKSLEFIVKDIDEHSIDVTIPSFRTDLLNKIDLFEEVARVYGYDNIPNSNIAEVAYSIIKNDDENFNEEIRSFLSLNGYNEHMSNSLINESEANLFSENYIKLLNYSSVDMSCLRNSILPGLFKAITFNQKRRKTSFKFFEIGKINNFVNKFYKEESILGIAWNVFKKRHWKGDIELDFFSIKGQLECIFKYFKGEFSLNQIKDTSEKFDLLFDLTVNNKKIGFLGKPSKKMMKIFDIKEPIYCSEIKIDNLRNHISKTNKRKFKKPSSFPVVDRDIALEVNKSVSADQIIQIIRKYGSELLKKVDLFDVYRDKSIDLEKQSIAFSLSFQSNKKTLVDKEVDIIVQKIIDELKNRLEIKQR